VQSANKRAIKQYVYKYIESTENSHQKAVNTMLLSEIKNKWDKFTRKLAATLRWFTAGGAIRIALRQFSQTWKLRHYDVTDDVITRKL